MFILVLDNKHCHVDQQLSFSVMLEQIVQRTAVVFHEEVNSLPDLASSFQVKYLFHEEVIPCQIWHLVSR
jgi:hypothetical protein